jgi:hypothetical protein
MRKVFNYVLFIIISSVLIFGLFGIPIYVYDFIKVNIWIITTTSNTTESITWIGSINDIVEASNQHHNKLHLTRKYVIYWVGLVIIMMYLIYILLYFMTILRSRVHYKFWKYYIYFWIFFFYTSGLYGNYTTDDDIWFLVATTAVLVVLIYYMNKAYHSLNESSGKNIKFWDIWKILDIY